MPRLWTPGGGPFDLRGNAHAKLSQYGLSVKLTPMETEGSWDAYVVRTNPDAETGAGQARRPAAFAHVGHQPNNALQA